MTYFRTLTGAASVAAIMTGSTAIADVTAADIWADWQNYLAVYGENGVTFDSADQNGAVLTVSNLKLSMEDDLTAVSSDMGDLVLTENGDGTVSVKMAETYPIVVKSQDGGGITMTIAQSGLGIVASGTPDAVRYDITADRYSFTVDEITEDGIAVPADIKVSVNNIIGNYLSTAGDLRNMTYAMTADAIDVLFDIAEPEQGGHVTFGGKIEGVETTGDMILPDTDMLETPEDMFAAGFDMDAAYTYENSAYIFDVDADGQTMTGSVSTGPGGITMAFDSDAFAYDGSVTDSSISIQSGSLPFPIDLTLAEYGFGVTMPLAASDDPADFGLRLNLTELGVNDMIWSMVDPAGQLPHDPVTAQIDLSGKAKLFFDLLDPDQAEQFATAETPGELNEMTLNSLKLSAGGAEVTGNGGFVFDNSDLETFDGVPRTTGDVTLNITGANALIDKLVEMGLLPQDQAMMGRMMMGMFARTVGDDMLTSTIEINEQGHVLANGQRIQ